jgi:hypothetical protein
MTNLLVRLPGQGLRIANASLVKLVSRTMGPSGHRGSPDPAGPLPPEKAAFESVRVQRAFVQAPELAVRAREHQVCPKKNHRHAIDCVLVASPEPQAWTNHSPSPYFAHLYIINSPKSIYSWLSRSTFSRRPEKSRTPPFKAQ